MKINDLSLKNTLILYLFILMLPFAFFFWMVPFFSDLIIGNDYTRFSIDHQLELMFSLKNGSYPLWVPGYAGGQTASALTLGQIFHPISHIASFLPGYWSGNALEWNTFIRLISLGCAHLLLFIFICKMRINYIIAFVLSAITVYNLQVLATFHYGASLESWTGYLFLCASIGLYCLEKNRWYGPLLIIASTYWIVCSGHPQMMYYGLLGAGMFTLLIPFFLMEMLQEKNYSSKMVMQFWLKTALWCGIGILLSSAYILPFYYDFISTNGQRVGSDYLWANNYLDTFMGTVNNFFQPLHTFTGGVFGGSCLFLIAALVPLVRLFKVKIPRVIWVSWIILFVAFLHMQGGRLPVHYFVWKYLPLASSFRIAGRISMIMPIFFMLILTWILSLKSDNSIVFGKKFKTSPISFLAIIAILFTGIYFILPASITSDCQIYSASSIRNISPGVLWVTFFMGGAGLITLFFYGNLPRYKFIISLVLCIITCAQITFCLKYGTWIEKKEDTISFEQMSALKNQSLDYSADYPGYGLSTAVALQQAENSFLEPFLGKLYSSFIVADSTDKAYEIMAEQRLPDQVVLENYIPDTTLKAKNTSVIENTLDQVQLVYSSFNRLVFEVKTAKHGFFGLGYPFSSHWSATVNGKATKVYRANGGNNAVPVPSGLSRVEFRYWSTSVAVGMIISIVIFVLTGFYFSFKCLVKKHAVVVSGIILFFGAGGFFIWHKSLYTGNNLNTEYSWSASPSQPLMNIAYGKRTSVSSLVSPGCPYIYGSGCAVDGDLRSASITGTNENPFWLVDLHHPQPISRIKLQENVLGSNFNHRPITLAFSNDGKNWGATSVSQKGPVINFNFPNPVPIRYIRLSASGICRLSFSEVEIYPPEENIKQVKAQ